MIDEEIAKILSQVSANDTITEFINVDDIIANSNKILESMTTQQITQIANDEEIQAKIAKLLLDIDSNPSTSKSDTLSHLMPSTTNFISPIPFNKMASAANNITTEADPEPLDFIQLMESDNSKETAIQNDENVFQLHNFAKKNKIMFNVFEFKEKKKLFHNMTKHKIKMTCMTAFDEVVFGGFSNGVIKLFSCVKESEIKSFSIQEEVGSVMAIDCSSDSNYIIAGYQNGFTVVWNTSMLKPVKVVNELSALEPEAVNKMIISIKFIKHVPGYYYYYITSDESGKVRKYTVGEGYVRTTATIDLLVDGTNPYFLLQVMKVSEDDQKTFPQFSNLKNTIVVLGNTEGVKLLYLNPETSNECNKNDLFTPSNNLSYETQDASFGIGYTSFFADTTEVQKLGRRKKQHGMQFSKEQMLFALSIDKYIFLYVVPVLKQKVELVLPVGKYTYTNPIIRLSFFSLSILFYFDKDKTVKVLNTKEIQNSVDDVGDHNDNDADENYEYSERTNDQLLPEIESTSLALDSNKTILRKHYYNYIISYPKRIFVFTKSTFHSASLFNWKDCLDKLISQEKWEEAFCLGINIYRGKITSLADIPVQEMIRKANVGANLKKILELFLNSYLRGSKSQIETMENKTAMRRLINFSIEFCIEIEAFDYLIKTIQPEHFPLMKAFFLENLNQFILSDVLSHQKIDLSTITSIVNPLIEKKNFFLFSKIISHLDKDSICNCHYLKSTCEEYNIPTALIYISSNQANKDFFSPIPHLFTKYVLSSEVPWSEFKSYAYYSEKAPLAELENCSQYLGHKLLWYCDLCIKGKRYPKMTSIPEAQYNKLIPKVYFYLLSFEVLSKILDFDSYSFFRVIAQFFLSEKILKIVVSIDDATYQSISAKYNLKYYHGVNVNNIKQLTIIDMLVLICKEKDNFFISHDLNEFLVSLSSKMTIDRKLLLNATKAIIGYHQKLQGLSAEKAFDKFNCHRGLQALNSVHIRDLSDNLNTLIDSMDDLSEEEFDDLLNVSLFSNLFLVRVHLLEKKGHYLPCVDSYFNCNIKELEKDVFAFILSTFDKVEVDSNVDVFYEFKQGILERFDQLAAISIEDLTKLAFARYKKEIDITIRQLDHKPSLQLSYLESVINEKVKEREKEMIADSHQEELNKMLLTHIELLIKLGLKNSIIKIIDEGSIYPLKDCLSLCLNNNIVDASIYIHQKMGNYLSALELSLDQLRKLYDQIVKCAHSNETKTYQWSNILEELRKTIRESESICEKSTDKESTKEEEIDQLWLTFINELYLFLTKLEKEKSTGELEVLKVSLTVEIENVLKKMSCYVSIQKILAKVTINFKPEQFEEFKALLHKLLTSFSHLTNVLLSAQNLFTHSIRYQVNDFKRLNTQGEHFKWQKCDACNRLFKKNNDEKIFVFKCRHIAHLGCISKEGDEVVCKVCGDVEDETSKRRMRKRSLISQKRVTTYDNEALEAKITKRKEDLLLGRLNAMDNDFLNKASHLR